MRQVHVMMLGVSNYSIRLNVGGSVSKVFDPTYIIYPLYTFMLISRFMNENVITIKACLILKRGQFRRNYSLIKITKLHTIRVPYPPLELPLDLKITFLYHFLQLMKKMNWMS